MKITIYIFCILLYVIGFSTYGYAVAADIKPVAVNGVIDLRHEQFNKVIALKGAWKFYWHQFLNPSDTETRQKAEIVKFPFTWQGYQLNGTDLPAFGYATYRLIILLPKSDQPLRLAVPDMYCSYNLFVNGKLEAVNGQVSTMKNTFVPQWKYEAVDLPVNTDTIRLTLQIANFIHSRGGISKNIFIGEKKVMQMNRLRAGSIDLILTGCLFMGGLFFFGLYVFGSRDKAILLFSMYCVIYSYRIIGTDNYMLHTLLPQLNWYITVRLEYMTLFAGIGLFGMYTRSLYPADVNNRIVSSIVGICVAFTTASLILPPFYFTQLVNPFLAVMLFCLLYVPYVYLTAWRKHRPGSLYALMSAFALMTVFGISLFHYWGLIPPFQLISFLCYVGFFFLQSLVLSHRVSFALKKSREEAEQGLIAKSDFLSTMSHEIRTPLNSVIGMSHLLLGNKPRPDQVEQLEVMLFSANNLLSIVNDVLDFNKIEAGKISFERLDMNIAAIARNIIAGLWIATDEKGIGLHLTIDEGLQHNLIGDPTRLSQVITNLVQNAIKFTLKGQVTVDIIVKEQTQIDVVLLVEITDTGIGIPLDKQKLIFDRFTQADSSVSRSFGGTGLGLAICKKILELQNSSLQLTSEEGKGSTFYFVQTFEKSSPATKLSIPNQLPKETDNMLAGITVLVVDDNPMNVLVAQTYLKRWGAAVDIATNGLEALNMVNDDIHQLILMDLHMPVMDGYEATKKIRKKGLAIPIIALTANLLIDVEEETKATGFDGVIMKPFMPAELQSKILLSLFNAKEIH